MTKTAIDRNRQLQQMKQSVDGLYNVVSGLGTNKAKRSHNQWAYDGFNNWANLDAAYQSNWIARQVVDVPARDATRQWRRIKSAQAEDITALEQELCLPCVIEEAVSWAGLYGGAGVLMITDQDLSKPLNLNAIKKGSLKRFMTFDRFDLTAQSMNLTDILAPNYLMPNFYNVLGGRQTIHWTHVARFHGERIPRRQMVQTQGWGDSVLRKCLSDISDMVASKDGIAELMQEVNIDVITRDGLNDELASDQDQDIIDRYELFSQMKSIVNMALLDGEETLERQTLNLSGVAPILDNFMTWISGAARIPLTKLFGTSAKGMNATGDGDMKNYYDDIRALQTSRIGISMRIIDEVMVRSATGGFPDDFDYEWNPLEQPNEVETAQAEMLQAQKSVTYLDAGVVQRSQIQRELQANEEYQFDDDQIDELEELEDPNLFEGMPGLGGEDPTGEREVNVPEPSTNLDEDSVFIERYSALIDAGVPHDTVMLRIG
jgi:phage-related protein (TIGR01555 family)